MKILGKAPISDVRRAADRSLADRALHLGEVRRPVSEGQHERQTEYDADPVAQWIGRMTDVGARPRRPAQQRLDDDRQRIEIDARDEHTGRGEGQPVEQVRALAEAPAQVLGHAVHLAAVVERHHHQRQEQHCRHGADPVEVHRRDAVLRAVGGVAQHLDRPRLAEMNASLVIQPGRDRPDRKTPTRFAARTTVRAALYR